MNITVYNLILEVTRKCNMCCEHCLRGDARSIDMQKSTVNKLLDKVSSIYTVTFTGGEPTLNLELIEYFFQETKRRGIAISSFWLATNGKEHQLELAKLLITYYPEMLEPEACGVALSVDAYHDEVDVNYLKALSFYDTSKQHDLNNDRGEWILSEGRAYDNGLSERGKRIDAELSVEYSDEYDEYSIEELYINAKEQIVAGCDFSYDTQEEVSLGTLDELENIIKRICENRCAA